MPLLKKIIQTFIESASLVGINYDLKLWRFFKKKIFCLHSDYLFICVRFEVESWKRRVEKTFWYSRKFEGFNLMYHNCKVKKIEVSPTLAI